MLKKLLPVQKNLTNLQEQVKNGSGSLDDLQDQIDKLQKELGQLVR
jgi:peptidoglycan hydrolase CwlO-like protein